MIVRRAPRAARVTQSGVVVLTRSLANTLLSRPRGAAPSRVVEPGPSGLRVWRLDLADPAWDLAAAAAVLDDAEWARAELGVPGVRRRRILLRAGLRVVVGQVLGVPPAQVPIQVCDGRPYLTGGPGLSCSASEGTGLVAVAPGASIGIDVERERETGLGDAAAEGWLAAQEQALLGRLPREEHGRALTRSWTQKEAVLKGSGTGLRTSPATVVTPIADRGRVGEWRLAPVPVPTGWVASLAVRSPVPLTDVPVTVMTPGELR